MTQEDEPDGRQVIPDANAPRLIVAVCTYRRNDQLRQLLAGLVTAAEVVGADASVGAVIVDDSADRQAQHVVADFAESLTLGVQYRTSGHQNISLARNIGLETAIPLGDWVVMTDDDCVPDPRWLAELLEASQRTGAEAISGRMIRRVPADAPRWLREQPFLEQGVARYESDSELAFASTHNSMMSSSWLSHHTDVRFDPSFGRLGGEDMVFFKSASAAGLRITYAPDAIVYEDQPAARLRYRFLLRQAAWLGNSTYATQTESGAASRMRMAVHGLARVGRGVCRPVLRLMHGRPPQIRFGLALVVGGLGTLVGVLGVSIRHH